MRKSYSIDQSPLYKIVGIKQLETRLKIKVSRLDKLLKEDSYRSFINAKGRLIQHPVGWLNEVHTKIANYLARIELPDYVYSKKTRSYVDNANEHKGVHQVAKTDISGYFPSITQQMIKQMFIDEFKCAKDVANILANICCYEQRHLPTGSNISGYIAFFACKKLFDQVYDFANKNSCTFTLYVDDLTVSGDKATKKFIYEIRKLIVGYGLNIKKSKTKTYSAYAPKLITGVVVKLNQCLLPNCRHKFINDTKIAIQSSENEFDKTKLKLSLKGRLQEAKQIIRINSEVNLSTSESLIYS